MKCVCEPCNGGWMHDLEDLNIPIIGCLMQDLALPLNSDQQLAVSRWAVKTSMVQDAIDRRKRRLFYTASERVALRSNTALPAYTRIWLGRSSLKTLTADGVDIGVDINDGAKVLELADGCVHTFAVGHLAIQVASIHAPAQYDGRPFDVTPQVTAPWDDLLVPVWPINRAVNWPPRWTLVNSRGIRNLSQRFSGGTQLTRPLA